MMEFKKDFSAYANTFEYDQVFANLYEPILYTLDNKGKQIRPVILLLSCDAFGGSIQKALPAAMAVEVFHNFTLLHDDIMDAAPIRRGKTSVYKKYGTNSAILSGDAMLIKSYQYLEAYETNLFKELLHVFSKTALEVCEGQQLDIDFETSDDVEIAAYLRMIELKTAVLIAASMEMGALIGGASKVDAAHMYEFGKNLGIAFQLHDDILDAYGEEKKIGKQQGGDIIQKKKTYLYLKTCELLEPAPRKEFITLYNGEAEDKVDQVMQIFNSVVVKEYANQVATAYLDLAISHLKALSIEKEKHDDFMKFVDGLMNRDK